jgi:hypothetical protein
MHARVTARAISRRMAGAGLMRRPARGGGGAPSAAAPEPITPETLGASYWLKAADLAAGAVSSWAPRVGTGTIVQATGALQPSKEDTVAAFGNQAAVNFSASTHKLAVAATYVVPLATPNGFTVVAVGQRLGASTYMWGQLSGTSARYGRFGTDRLRLEEAASTITSDAITLTNVASFAWQCTSARVVRFFINGVQVGADQTLPSFTAAGAAGQFILGDVGGPGFIGYLSDLFAFPTSVAASVLLSAHADYAAPEYGL